MATASTRSTSLQFSGDLEAGYNIEAAANPASPGIMNIVDLSSGANTITVPTAGDSVPTAVTIKPPVGNEESIILKGITGDTGVRLHDTDPTTIALDDSVTSFVITAGAAIEGVRLYWS